MKQKAAQTVQPEIHLRPNELVACERVAAVMAAAQRLGLKKLGMVGNEQFIRPRGSWASIIPSVVSMTTETTSL